MDQRVDQEFAHDHLVESRYVLAVKAIRQFVALAEIGHFQPDSLDQFHRIQGVVVPHELVDLLALVVVLDELDHRGGGQLRTLMLLPDAQDAQMGQVAILHEQVVIKQLVIGLFLDGRLDSVRCPKRICQLAELVRIGG